MVWRLFPLKGDFSLGKSQKLQGTKSGLLGGLSHLGDLMFAKNSAWDVMREQAGCDEAANLQLLVAAAFWVIQIVSVEECSGLMKNSMQICCSTRSVTLNVLATQYTRSLNDVYHPHWLVQRSRHCSHTRIPVHSPWLPGYTSVT